VLVEGRQDGRSVVPLANRYLRCEFNDLARRLDNQADAMELCERLVPAPASSISGLSPDGYRYDAGVDRWR
jgi:hypothetical protein